MSSAPSAGPPPTDAPHEQAASPLRRVGQYAQMPLQGIPLGVAAVLSAVTPLLVLAGIVAHRRPRIDLVADQALVQLTAINAGHHAQLLGPYSRFGWHHPGPSWFYLLDAAFLPLGSHGWSLLVTAVLLHALVVAAIVLVVWRWRGAAAALLTALLVLVFLRSLGGDLFLNPWNPYAIVLPLALFVVLAGATAEASATGFAGLLLVASVVVQTHVSTVPAVGAVVGVAGVLGGIEARRRRRHDLEPYLVAAHPPSRREQLHLCGGISLVLLIALAWVPPAIEQLGNRPGNLRAVIDFFRSAHPDHSLLDGIGAVGRDLTVFPFGSYDPDLAVHLGTQRAQAGLALGVFLLASGLLVALARRARDRLARGIGAACLVAALAATWSVTRVVGPVDAYLLTWVTALPLALAIGYACLLAAPGRLPALAARLRSATGEEPWRVAGRGLALVAAVLTAFLLAGEVRAVVVTRPENQAPAWAAPVDDAVSAAVAAMPAGTVLLSTDQYPAWPVATGITVRLVQDGRPVEVPDRWLGLWGDQFSVTRNAGAPAVEVLVVAAGQPGSQPPPAGARPVASAPGVDVYVVRGAGRG